jgi:hypothetical protein
MRAIQALPPAALFERSLSRKPHTRPDSPKPHLSRHPSGFRIIHRKVSRRHREVRMAH